MYTVNVQNSMVTPVSIVSRGFNMKGVIMIGADSEKYMPEEEGTYYCLDCDHMFKAMNVQSVYYCTKCGSRTQ